MYGRISVIFVDEAHQGCQSISIDGHESQKRKWKLTLAPTWYHERRTWTDSIIADLYGRLKVWICLMLKGSDANLVEINRNSGRLVDIRSAEITELISLDISMELIFFLHACGAVQGRVVSCGDHGLNTRREPIALTNVKGEDEGVELTPVERL